MILFVGPSYPVNLNDLKKYQIIPACVFVINWREYNYFNIGNNPSLDGLLDYVNEKNIPLYIINGTWNDFESLYQHDASKFKNVVHIENFGLYVLKHTYIRFLTEFPHHLQEDYGQTFNSPELKFSFICLNNKPHPHRCTQMDLLAKFNLLDKNAISWNSWFNNEGRKIDQSLRYKWRYWNPKLLVLDEMQSDGWGCQVPEEYKYAATQLITETSSEVLIFSEKLVPALIYNKPFLVSGPKGYHKKLEELGFKLYTEIFNYDFDLIDDMTDRFEKIAENFKNLETVDLTYLRDITQETTNFNKRRFVELMESSEFYSNFMINFNAAMINYIEDNVLEFYRKQVKELI